MTGLLAPGWLLVPTAHAQCAPNGTPNADVVCDANDSDGFLLPAGDLSSFFVQPDVTVSSVLPDAVFVDGVVGTLINQGQIAATLANQDAVDLGGIGPGGFSNFGTIGANDGVGVFVNGPVTGIINNAGLIFGIGGIIVNDDLPSLINSGVIDANDDGVFALTIDNLTNTGTISAGDEGVQSNVIANLINHGQIFGAENGVEAFDIGSLVNFGRITSLGDGIDVDGGDPNDETSVINQLVNHGTIHGNDDGIDVGTLTSLVNTGTIAGGTTDGLGNSGIAAAVITNIVNSGMISAGNPQDLGYAIEERGPFFAANEDTTLTLNAGSVLIGYIDLGGGTNTLNIGEGRSLNSTFDGDIGFATLPVLGNTNGALIAFLDTTGAPDERQIVAVDQSAFLSFDDALHALVLGIGQTVQGRQSALRSDPALGFASRYAAAEETSLAAFSDLDLDRAQHLNPNRFWIEGFGAYRQDDGDRVGGNFDHLTGGLVAGVDVPLDALTSIGFMAGFAASTSENEIDTQSTDTMSYYAGVYASTQALGVAWDASLTVGYTDYDQERITANNLVAGGLETASADFGGWFINPQVTITRQATNPLAGSALGTLIATNTLEQSLTLSYAGLFLDGYTETGTTNPLTLDDRDIHVASARAALALPFEQIEADGALSTLRLIGGVEARTQFGNDSVSGVLLGRAVSTTLDDDDFSGGAFVGLAGEYQTTGGMTAYANAEALLETSAAWQLSATAGLRIAF